MLPTSSYRPPDVLIATRFSPKRQTSSCKYRYHNFGWTTNAMTSLGIEAKSLSTAIVSCNVPPKDKDSLHFPF